MGTDRDFDSSGKGKSHDARARSGVLLMALLGGACLGLVLSERLYIKFHQPAKSDQAIVSKEMGGRRNLGQVIDLSLQCTFVHMPSKRPRGSQAQIHMGHE